MNPIQLAGLVKRAYPDFDMTIFNNRLKLQKFIYLMKISDLDLGYNFRLYLRGPYATLLAKDGFDMPNIQECKEIKFENEASEKKFIKLLNFLSDKKDDIDKMEVIASLYKFHEIYPGESDDEIIKHVEDKSPRFAGRNKEIRKLLIELKKCEVIKW